MTPNRAKFRRLVERSEVPGEAAPLVAPKAPVYDDPLADTTEGLSIRTQAQVAALMTERGYPMSRARVFTIEQRALKKLRRDPVLRKFAEEAGVRV